MGGSVFRTNSATTSALASAGIPLFDAILNSQCQRNVGFLQISSSGAVPQSAGQASGSSGGGAGGGYTGGGVPGNLNGGNGSGAGSGPLNPDGDLTHHHQGRRQVPDHPLPALANAPLPPKKCRREKKKKYQVTRKEAEKVSVPVHPKMLQWDLWQSQLTMLLVAASGDSD